MLRICGFQLGFDPKNSKKNHYLGCICGFLARMSPKEVETYYLKLVFQMLQGILQNEILKSQPLDPECS